MRKGEGEEEREKEKADLFVPSGCSNEGWVKPKVNPGA